MRLALSGTSIGEIDYVDGLIRQLCVDTGQRNNEMRGGRYVEIEDREIIFVPVRADK